MFYFNNTDNGKIYEEIQSMGAKSYNKSLRDSDVEIKFIGDNRVILIVKPLKLIEEY